MLKISRCSFRVYNRFWKWEICYSKSMGINGNDWINPINENFANLMFSKHFNSIKVWYFWVKKCWHWMVDLISIFKDWKAGDIKWLIPQFRPFLNWILSNKLRLKTRETFVWHSDDIAILQYSVEKNMDLMVEFIIIFEDGKCVIGHDGLLDLVHV